MSIPRSRAWRSLLLPAVAALAFAGCDTSISSSLRDKENPEQPPTVDGGSVALRLDAQACIAIDIDTDSLRVLVKDPAGGILSQRSVVLSTAGISLDFPGIPSGPGRLVEVVGFDRFGNIHWYGAASVEVVAGSIAYARITLRKATGTIHVDIDLDTVDIDTTIPPIEPPPAIDTIPVIVSDLPSGGLSLADLSAYRMGDKIVATIGVVPFCQQPTVIAYASPVELTIYPAPPAEIRLVVPKTGTCSERYVAPETVVTQNVFPEGTLGSTATVLSAKRTAPARDAIYFLPRLTYVTVVIDLGTRYGKRDVMLSSGNANDPFRIDLPAPGKEPCYSTYDANGVCILPPPPTRCIAKYDADGKVVDSICPVILPAPILIPRVEPIIERPVCPPEGCSGRENFVVQPDPIAPTEPTYPYLVDPIPGADSCTQLAADLVVCMSKPSVIGDAWSQDCSTNAGGVTVCQGSASEGSSPSLPAPGVVPDPTTVKE